MPIPSTLGWYSIPSSTMRPFVPVDGIYGGYSLGYPPYIIEAWNSAVFDSARNRFIIWGGGHADYSGNEIYAFDLTSLTWSRITNPGLPPTNSGSSTYEGIVPTDSGAVPGQQATGTEGTQANARHTYDGIEYMANVDKMFVFGGSLSWGGNPGRGTWAFDFATNTWERKFPSGTIPAALVGCVSAYDSNTGKVFLHNTAHLFAYTYSTNNWQQLATETFLPAVDYHLTATIDPVRKKFVMCGGGQAWIYDISTGSSYLRQALSTTGGSAIINSNSPGLEYDPASGNIIGWTGGGTVFSLNLDTNVWTPITYASGPGSTPSQGTFGHWRYSPTTGVFIVVTSIDQPLYTLRLGAAPVANVTSFGLTSTLTGTLPFTIGMGFKKGDVVGTPTLNIADHQVVVKRTWNDGSVKHAIISGHAALTANTLRNILISSGGTAPTGTVLTSASIQAASPAATVQVGSIGTVSLPALLASPFRTWISGIEMVECHYRSNVGSDATLSVWFHVRLYKNGRVWVRAIVENGYLTGTVVSKSYVPTVNIGGTNVYTNGGATLTHHTYTRWSVEGWIGGDPAVTPKHDSQYLIDTKLVPNYWKKSPTATTLNALTQTYAPMQIAPQQVAMADAGFSYGIGTHPNWSALYVTSTDPRAYRAALAGSSAFNTYSITRRSSTTQRIPRPSDNPTIAISGGTFNLSNPTATWEVNHLFNDGYIAYLISGDFWHLETLAFNGAACYACISTTNGTGVNKILRAETRGVPWMLQPIGHFCAIAPTVGDAADIAVLTDFQSLLQNNNTYWQGIKNTAGINLIGKLYTYATEMGAFGRTGDVAPWMQEFWPVVWGQLSNMDPLSSMTAWNDVRDWLYRWPVGLCGGNGALNYCFTRAGSEFEIVISASNNADPTTHFDTWGEVWTASFGSQNTGCTNTLAGSNTDASNDPARASTNHRWGVFLNAIALATEHAATGAAEAWARFTGATNFSEIENGRSTSNFSDVPIWGIYPRTVGSVPPPVLPNPPTNLRRA